jgi:hypothetical protein
MIKKFINIYTEFYTQNKKDQKEFIAQCDIAQIQSTTNLIEIIVKKFT